MPTQSLPPSEPELRNLRVRDRKPEQGDKIIPCRLDLVVSDLALVCYEVVQVNEDRQQGKTAIIKNPRSGRQVRLRQNLFLASIYAFRKDGGPLLVDDTLTIEDAFLRDRVLSMPIEEVRAELRAEGIDLEAHRHEMHRRFAEIRDGERQEAAG